MHVERIIPHLHYGPSYSSYAEHLGRYMFVARLLGPTATVLDLGCGSGYGAAYLAEASGRTVIGVDLSAEAISYARNHCQMHRLSFLRATAPMLPIKSESVDAAIALEVIEHVKDAKAVVCEIRRILKPAGICVVSTPNRLVNGTGMTPDNPYHVREYTPEEFRTLLRVAFAEFSLYGQAYTPAFLAFQENMRRIWHNLSLIPTLFHELHALRSRLERDERLIGLALLRKLKQKLARNKKETAAVSPEPTADVERAFRHMQALVNSMADREVTPYGIEKAPVIVAVCRA
ncbi:MAG: class I SAM-dependent methyltransferase [Nitrospirota bacterium]